MKFNALELDVKIIVPSSHTKTPIKSIILIYKLIAIPYHETIYPLFYFTHFIFSF
jgi:hypothetical protein